MLRVSPVYETEPVDLHDQRWFLNLVVEAETELFPCSCWRALQTIERALGRVRTVPQGAAHHRYRYPALRRERWCARRGWKFRTRAWRSAASCWRRWPTWRRICAIR